MRHARHTQHAGRCFGKGSEPAMDVRRWIALVTLVLGGLALFVWIPLDSDGGMFERVRRRTVTGDGFAPSLAAAILVLSALILAFERQAEKIRLTTAGLRHIFTIVALLAVSGLVMLWLGPLSLLIIDRSPAEYRLLRDDVPFKYIGYLAGGSFLVGALICHVEQRLHWFPFVIGAVGTLALAAIHDLPFNDLLLPPNGDY